MTTLVTTSTIVFACHSAACRPPTSGGTGGSSGKGGGRSRGTSSGNPFPKSPQKPGTTRTASHDNTTVSIERESSGAFRVHHATKRPPVGYGKEGYSHYGTQKAAEAAAKKILRETESGRPKPASAGQGPRPLSPRESNALAVHMAYGNRGKVSGSSKMPANVKAVHKALLDLQDKANSATATAQGVAGTPAYRAAKAAAKQAWDEVSKFEKVHNVKDGITSTMDSRAIAKRYGITQAKSGITQMKERAKKAGG